jgi:hypothetical protein
MIADSKAQARSENDQTKQQLKVKKMQLWLN